MPGLDDHSRKVALELATDVATAIAHLRADDPAPAAHSADDPPAHASVGRVHEEEFMMPVEDPEPLKPRA